MNQRRNRVAMHSSMLLLSMVVAAALCAAELMSTPSPLRTLEGAAAQPLLASPPSLTPEQVHISFMDNTRSRFTISWVTWVGGTSIVSLSTDSSKVLQYSDMVFRGSSFNYTYNLDPAERSQWTISDLYHSGNIHHVNVTGLRPRTTYYYCVGDKSAPSSVFSFNSGRGRGDDQGVLTVALVGDLGQTAYSTQTVSKITDSRRRDGSLEFALLIGDLSYADGGAERWDSWGRMMEPLTSSIPFMTLPGNHEIEMDSISKEPFSHYRRRYRMPGGLERIRPGMVKSWGSYDFDLKYAGGSSYYSFDVGLAHFICLNTYDTGYRDSDQATFLDRDLASVDRAVTPWIFVFSHGPWYNANMAHQNEVSTIRMRDWAEPLLIMYKADAAFAGHVHAYSRSKPLAYGKSTAGGVMHVTLGDGGNYEGLKNNWISPLPEWVAYKNGQSYGHGELRIINRTHAFWEYRPDEGAASVDSVWLLNNYMSSLSPSSPPSSPSPPPSSGGISGVGVFFLVLFILGGTGLTAVFVVRRRREVEGRARLQSFELVEESDWT